MPTIPQRIATTNQQLQDIDNQIASILTQAEQQRAPFDAQKAELTKGLSTLQELANDPDVVAPAPVQSYGTSEPVADTSLDLPAVDVEQVAQ